MLSLTVLLIVVEGHIVGAVIFLKRTLNIKSSTPDFQSLNIYLTEQRNCVCPCEIDGLQ